MDELEIHPYGGAMRFEVRVQPRASRVAIVGVHDGALKVALTAPPVEGEANAALVRLIAKRLAVPRRDVRIASGDRSRTKVLEVAGIDAPTLRARLGTG
jgi:uncharacterized protein